MRSLDKYLEFIDRFSKFSGDVEEFLQEIDLSEGEKEVLTEILQSKFSVENYFDVFKSIIDTTNKSPSERTKLFEKFRNLEDLFGSAPYGVSIDAMFYLVGKGKLSREKFEAWIDDYVRELEHPSKIKKYAKKLAKYSAYSLFTLAMLGYLNAKILPLAYIQQEYQDEHHVRAYLNHEVKHVDFGDYNHDGKQDAMISFEDTDKKLVMYSISQQTYGFLDEMNVQKEHEGPAYYLDFNPHHDAYGSADIDHDGVVDWVVSPSDDVVILVTDKGPFFSYDDRPVFVSHENFANNWVLTPKDGQILVSSANDLSLLPDVKDESLMDQVRIFNYNYKEAAGYMSSPNRQFTTYDFVVVATPIEFTALAGAYLYKNHFKPHAIEAATNLA